jgi:hypothetical protein
MPVERVFELQEENRCSGLTSTADVSRFLSAYDLQMEERDES